MPEYYMYHPNAKGTGCAIKVSLHPARLTPEGSVAGGVFIKLAAQKTVGSRTPERVTFPTFDWDNEVAVKLDANDISHFISVLRGMEESVSDGKGLYHRTATHVIVIRFEHRIEPCSGYLLTVSAKHVAGDNTERTFMFSNHEAIALCQALEQSILYVALGVPR